MYIEKLTGTYERLLSSGIIIDVSGVGYGLEMPLSSLCELPPLGEKVSIWTYTHVREDSIRLFGFVRFEDRAAFEVMLSLSGVGPKVALAILSTLNLSAIRRAIQHNDPQILVSVPGVGPRLAEKILVELKPKLEKLKFSSELGIDGESGRLSEGDFDHVLAEERFEKKDEFEVVLGDVKSALENLGFKEKSISPVILSIRNSSPGETFQVVMKEALKLLSESTQKEVAKKVNRKKPGAISKDKELF